MTSRLVSEIELERYKCKILFPSVVIFREKISRSVKYDKKLDLYYVPTWKFYDVLIESNLAKFNPKNIKWLPKSIKPIDVELENSGILKYKVDNGYEFSSLLYHIASRLEYGNIVILTDLPKEFWIGVIGKFISCKTDTMFTVPISHLFKVIKDIMPIYCLIFDPSIEEHVIQFIGEVYSFLCSKLVVIVDASPDEIIKIPYGIRELSRISPNKSKLLKKRYVMLKTRPIKKEISPTILAKRVLFSEELVVI